MLMAAFAVVLVLLLAAAAVALVVYRRPLAAYGHLQRRALRRSGLHPTPVTTGAGRQVVWVGGSGPLLVLLHGAGDDGATWAPVVPALLAGHRVAVLDLPGHGESEPSSGPLPFAALLQGVEQVLHAVAGESPAVIVGNSLGAWLGMVLAVRHPERVARLVLVNGGAIPGERSDITFTPETREEARRTLEALMGPRGAKAPAFVLDDLIRVCRFGPLGRFAQTADSMGDYVLTGRLHEVTVPTDLLWGTDDRVFPVSYAQRLLDGLPAARLTRLDGCGHVPHRTNPARFVRQLLDLLSRPAPEASRVDS